MKCRVNTICYCRWCGIFRWGFIIFISRTGEGSFASFLYVLPATISSGYLPRANRQMSHHLPSSTFPPGLTFSFLRHKDALNINIAYSSDIISNIELGFYEAHLLQNCFCGTTDVTGWTRIRAGAGEAARLDFGRGGGSEKARVSVCTSWSAIPTG